MKNTIKQDPNYISPLDIEKQESLTLERLSYLKSSNRLNPNNKPRPESNFIDLMDWVLDSSVHLLKDHININKFVHNRIIIDGPFLQFCKERSISIECIYKDSVISWKTDNEYEKFFVQGVFIIRTKDVEFIHAALFHKGNQNEDEVSFFILVSESNFNGYLKIRNEFDSWIQERDRSNLHIRVIDGDDIPYEKDSTWEDLFLPENIKLELKGLVENFLSSQDFYLKNKIPWKRGFLLYGKPGCHSKGSKIMMYDGSFVNVEDVEVGDLLMGPDSEPREVLKLVRGNENMYRITPNKGDSFIVNENHILHLNYSSKQTNFPKSINISVDQYLGLSKCLKEKLKLVKSSRLIFNSSEDFLELDPYLLGVWLGDGTCGKSQITSADPEIIEYCKQYALDNNLNCMVIKSKSKAFSINFSHKTGGVNVFTKALRDLGIYDKKDIPQKYLTASVDNRLKLLAGIIDTDDSYNCCSWRASEKYNKKGIKGVFDLIQKDPDLSNKIKNLALSLGLGFTIKKCTKTIKSISFSGTYYRMCVYGNIEDIPILIKRKKALITSTSKYNKDPHNIGIRSVDLLGKDDYYGFILDKNHLYVSDDFIIQHNCGKTSIIRTIISVYNFKPVTIVPEASDDSIREAFAYAQEQSPSLLYFEDLDSLLDKKADISSFLNLMDGISTRNGLLVIATANEINKLKKNITDRPSRFDRKFEIPLPTQEMAYIYLRRWFGNLVTVKKCQELAKYASQNDFSYAYLKELYISSMFEALSHNRKSPIISDINVALNVLVKDKNILNSKSIKTDKYFGKES